jgi:hypothetical protein
MNKTLTPSEFNDLPLLLALARDPETEGVVVMLDPTSFEHPGAWGIVIADLVQHVANAYAQDGLAAAPVLAEIRRIVLAELDAPTDKAVPMRWEIA